VALGEGYWRWAFWADASRQVYERLWGSLADWVVGGDVARGPDAVGPAQPVVARGTALRWVAAGLSPDSLRVQVSRGDSTVVQATIPAAGADTVSTPSLPPGHYRYDVAAFVAGESVQGEGELTVESYSDDYTRPPVDPALLEAAPTALEGPGAARTPLHATTWPWALLIVLLAAEWVLRRRWGLR
jgi:hypothetical protein